MRKICILAGYGYTARFVQRVNLAKQCGFDQVFLSMRRYGKRLAFFEDICLGIELCRANDIEVQFIHLPNLKEINTLWEDGNAGDIYCDYLIGLIAQCTLLGVKTFVLHTHYKKSISPTEPTPYALPRFQRLARACEKFNVKLAIENTENYVLDTYILENIISPNVGLCYDSGHENYFYSDNEKDILDRFGKRLFCVHLHDNNGKADEHLLPFEGNIDWSVVLGKLKKCPKVPVTLELKNMNYIDEEGNHIVSNPELREDAEKFLKHAANTARKIAKILN